MKIQKLSDPKPSKARIIKVMEQRGFVKSILRDISRTALLPGKRISKNGNVYWETRVNRSDRAGKKV